MGQSASFNSNPEFDSTPGGIVTLSSSRQKYVQIGSLIMLDIYLSCAVTAGELTGVTLTLPVTHATASNVTCLLNAAFIIPGGSFPVLKSASTINTSIRIKELDGDTISETFGGAGTLQILVSGCYEGVFSG